jgi:hypothetical protein
MAGFGEGKSLMAITAYSLLESFPVETPMTSDAAQEPDSGKSRFRSLNDCC